jgi:hypothetical protein
MATKSMPERREPTAAEQQPVVSKVEARGGVTGHNARYVLGFGVVAIIVIFVAIWLVYFG